MLFTHIILGKHYTAKIYLLKLASLFQNVCVKLHKLYSIRNLT